MSSTKRLQFEETIEAPVATVWETMLGPESYPLWTAAFCDGSRYEGTWEEGGRIRFLAPSGDGMIAEIAENRPHAFLSIRHLGYIMNGVEDTESESIRAWAPAYENYTFRSVPDGTRVTVDQDVTAEFEQLMSEAWPRALGLLKKLCEDDGTA